MEYDRIDWAHLAKSFESASGNTESGSDDLARQVVAELLGPQTLIEAVDYYVHNRHGAELVRSVLRLLRPAVAIERCLALYADETNIDVRRASVELLRFIAGRQLLPAVKRFLEDPDETIQNWGVSLLDQLILDESIGVTEADEYLRVAERHPNPNVRQTALAIRGVLN